MTTLTRLTAALAVAGLLAASAALAGQRAPSLEKMDADGDGAVSQAEFEDRHAQLMQGLDANNDGAVTFEEAQEQRARHREELARRRFAKMDADGDGVVSVAEFTASHASRFERMDKNDDGAISGEELARGHRMHRRHRDGHGH
jgi:Ca2+-binding EF-hand superfamily protein